MPLVDPTCLLGLTQEERRYQLYLAVGGEDDNCLQGLPLMDQYRDILTLIGSDACIFTPWDFWAEWILFLDPTACTGYPIDGLQNALYALLYAEADDDALPLPECFLGLPPEERFDLIIEAISGETPPVVATLTRLSTGLILNEPFNNISAWDNEGGWSFVASDGLFAFATLPSPLFSPGVLDPDGVREGVVFQQSENLWYAVSDGGNGVDGWRQFLRRSTDRGLSWTELGEFAGGIGVHAATATGWYETRGATNLDLVVTAQNTFAAPNVGLPAGPYGFEIRTSTSTQGTWSVFGSVAPVLGTWSDVAVLPGSTVLDGVQYVHFAQGQEALNFNIGILLSSDPRGPWTQPDTLPIADFTVTAFGGRAPENPKAFYHPLLDKWVCLVNLIATSGQFTDSNAQLLSSSSTNWAGMTVHVYQSVVPCFGENVIGVATHITGPNGALVYDEDTGIVPIVYDTDSTRFSPGFHLGRHERMALLNPSRGSAHFLGFADAVAPMTRPLVNGDFVAEFLAKSNVISPDNVSFEFRRNAAGTDAYRLVLRNGGRLLLQSRVAGTYATVQNCLTGVIFGTESWSPVRVETSGSSITANFAGEEQINATDASLPTGGYIAFSGFGDQADFDIRLLRIYTSSSVTVQGLEAGEVIYLRSATLPVQSATANGSGVATFTLDNWPHLAVEIRGVEYTVGGPIYGGDVLEFSILP